MTHYVPGVLRTLAAATSRSSARSARAPAAQRVSRLAAASSQRAYSTPAFSTAGLGLTEDQLEVGLLFHHFLQAHCPLTHVSTTARSCGKRSPISRRKRLRRSQPTWTRRMRSPTRCGPSLARWACSASRSARMMEDSGKGAFPAQTGRVRRPRPRLTVPYRYLDHLIVMEEISRASGSIGLSYGAQ